MENLTLTNIPMHSAYEDVNGNIAYYVGRERIARNVPNFDCRWHLLFQRECDGEIINMSLHNAKRVLKRVPEKDSVGEMEREYYHSLLIQKKFMFEQISKIKTPGFLDQFKTYLKSIEGAGKIEFSHGRAGKKQEVDSEDLKDIKYEWVNQSCGICGDDYFGQVYVHLIDDIYIKIHFEC